MKPKVKSAMFCGNGNIAAFDEANEQIPELQRRSAIELWASDAASRGYDVVGCEVRTLYGMFQIEWTISDGFYARAYQEDPP